MKSSTRTPRLLSLLLLLLAGACVAQEPDVVTPPDNPAPVGSQFADVVLGLTDGGMAKSCIEGGGVPLCGSNPQPQPGPCANNPALGMNDGKFFSVPPLGRIELGLLCGSITEVGLTSSGGASTDFRVWAMVDPGAIPVVEISMDGTHYVTVNPWPRMDNGFQTNPGFQLEAAGWASARFVRISESGGAGAIQVDALEALPRIM
jgi:hypothetical protein